MAYVNQEKKAKIAAALKEAVPAGWKYSLAVRHHSTLVMTLSESPVDFLGKQNRRGSGGVRTAEERAHSADEAIRNGHLNVYLPRLKEVFDGLDPATMEAMEKIQKALNIDNHDRGDPMSDYSDVGHYVEFRIGRWDKPYRLVAESDRPAAPRARAAQPPVAKEDYGFLSVSRKEDRVAMARTVQALAEEFGYPVATESSGAGRNERTTLRIDTGAGLRTSVWFTAATLHPNQFVVPWVTTGDCRLTAAFSRVGGEVNPHHFGKCTAVNYGFEELMNALRTGFEMVRDGSAFQKAPRAVEGEEAADGVESAEDDAEAEAERPRG